MNQKYLNRGTIRIARVIYTALLLVVLLFCLIISLYINNIKLFAFVFSVGFVFSMIMIYELTGVVQEIIKGCK